ncbi:hypothetical protein [Pseudaminobacter soli (ex Li et al. 2025)]|uniref:Uncharacterized protein n=1 Tax=Pseudaminobacter soli (ex Li et al. 2025) TaxID=1295366 RepID=A0A2P7S9D0_9HYPH|nr:hypothetical protein [Mesorhizobium soli]PSJ58915.1 hypothetical protein C7I85_18325 [Mesorhizobium soli]
MPATAAPVARTRMDATVRILAFAFTVLILAYIAIPVLVTPAMSFSDAAAVRFPIKACSAVFVSLSLIMAWYIRQLRKT